MTAEQLRSDVMQARITGGAQGARSRQLGDEAGALIAKIIGPNALDESETRNVLSIIRTSFGSPDRIPLAAKNPSATRRLLNDLADATELESLKRQIAETLACVEAQ